MNVTIPAANVSVPAAYVSNNYRRYFPPWGCIIYMLNFEYVHLLICLLNIYIYIHMYVLHIPIFLMFVDPFEYSCI